MGNLDTRVTIKNVCDQQNPDSILIAKTMIPYAHFLVECSTSQ